MRLKNFNWRRISLEHLWGITVLVGVFAFLNTSPIRPHDSWWHMAVGREILATGAIPRLDTFSFTAYGQPYSSYLNYWLMDILMYLVFLTGGEVLVILAHSIAITSVYGLIFWICWKQSRNWRVSAFATLYAAAMGFDNWNVRPQTITFILGVLFLWVIYQYRAYPNKKLLAVFPVGMVLWINSHGSFVIGLTLIAIWLADEVWVALRRDHLTEDSQARKKVLVPLLVLLLSTVACLVNPSGLGFVQYLSTMAANPVVQRYIFEWAPPTFQIIDGAIFFVCLLLTSVILAVSPRRPSLFQLLLFITFALLSLKYIRGIIWFGLVMAPVVAEHGAAILEYAGLTKKSSYQSAGKPVLNLLFLVILGVVAILSLPWFKSALPLVEKKQGLVAIETPVAAVDFLLDNETPANLFNEMAFGSYLIWKAQPDYKVFVDSRIELYPPELWGDYLEISSAVQGWEQKLDRYGINTLMLSPEEQPALVEAANASGNWKEIYRDRQAVIFVSRNH